MTKKELKDKFQEAKKINSDEKLIAFIKELMVNTKHDYGTVVDAMAAIAIAALEYANTFQGITGSQAGFIMWSFIREWKFKSNKCGLKLVDYDKMLYPQYKDYFEKTISAEIFKKLQEVASEKLKDTNHVHPAVIQHWQSIAEGQVPFGYKIKEKD